MAVAGLQGAYPFGSRETTIKIVGHSDLFYWWPV